VVQYLGEYKKGIAVELRMKGFSYSEIANSIHVPKSTVVYWVGRLKLNPEQKKKLAEKQSLIARQNSEKRILKTSKLIQEIKLSAKKDIGKVSKREFWLMGVMLYWRERFNSNDLRKGVRFSSSNPDLIKLFLKWLKEIGKIENEEIKFDVFIPNTKRSITQKVIGHWSEVVSSPVDTFTHIYYQRVKKLKYPKKDSFGFLRIRVRSSSMLARQIAGWIEGIK